MAKNERTSSESEDKRDIFISYSSKDKTIAEKLRQAVNSLQYTAFFDEDVLPGSQEWNTAIAKNINNCKLVLFYRTENSVASEWCARELRMAENKQKPIIPVVDRSKQNCLPDSEKLQALLVNLQNTFIDEMEPPAAIRENLRRTLENAIGKGSGNFGEISGVLHDMLRQAAAAMNSGSEKNVIQYGYDDSDGAQLYKELHYGDRTAVFRMTCRKSWGKNIYEIYTSIKCFAPKNTEWYNKISDLADDSQKGIKKLEKAPHAALPKNPKPGEIPLDRIETEFKYLDDKQKKISAPDAFNAVMKLIYKASQYFPVWDKLVGDLQKKSESLESFFGDFQGDETLKEKYSIYREEFSFSLVPKTQNGKRPDGVRLGSYDSIEINRPEAIIVDMKGLFSDKPTIRVRRFYYNKSAELESKVEQPLLDIDKKDQLMKTVKNLIAAAEDVSEEELLYRNTFEAEKNIRQKLADLISTLSEKSLGEWIVTSSDDKNVFTAIGKYQYADGEKKIVSPLRLKIAIDREKKKGGFALFHIDEPQIPTFSFEPDFKEQELAYFPPEIIKKNPFEREIYDENKLEDFIDAVTGSWEKVENYIDHPQKGKGITIFARINNLRTKFAGYFKKQGSVLASLKGDTVNDQTPGERIAWSLRMDHRFYRDLSKLAGDPIPFCPFIQFIGPGMDKWSYGWETTQEFRALPRSVKHFFWRAVFGDKVTEKGTKIEPNGDSVYFNQKTNCFDNNNSPARCVIGAMKELENTKVRLASIWECLSDPDVFEDKKKVVTLTVEVKEKGNNKPKPPPVATGDDAEKKEIAPTPAAAVAAGEPMEPKQIEEDIE